jgi:hypothetical protein
VELKLRIILYINICFCFSFQANAYDRCKDILRDGVSDTLSSNNNVERQLANHYQFCSTAKEYDLNENNFDAYVRNHSDVTKAITNSYGGGAKVGIGIFSGRANYNQSNNRNNASTSEDINELKANKKKILDYYDKNCGSGDYEETLKAEAVSLSKIANKNIVKAWRDCMVKGTGFFVYVIPSSLDPDEDEIGYEMSVHWRSQENIQIASIFLRFNGSYVETPYPQINERGNYRKTKNICEYEGYILENNSVLPISVTHKDRSKSTNVNVMAKTSTGVLKCYVATLPKTLIPEPIKLEQEEDAYWTIEHFCNNLNCNQYKRNFRTLKHDIAENFVTNSSDLNGGTCNNCRQYKKVRFGFKNCRFKMRARKSAHDVINETMEDIAFENFKYIYPFELGNNYYRRIRIITDSKSSPSLERDEI